jgi:hypothetical protein
VIYGAGIWNYTPPFNNITYVTATAGTHVRVNGNQGTQETGIITITSDATPNLTTATIVSRDASGNFAANMITANLTGNVTGAVSGNAGSVTNGVYTTGNQSIDGTKTFTNTIQGTITTATFATNFNTNTVVTAALSANTATNAEYAYSFNTGTLVTRAVSVTGAAQPAITSVGTLTNLVVSNTATLGNITLTSNSIYSSNTTTDITIGQTLASANIVMNRKTVFAKDISMSSSTTITTPRIVINDGGLRTVSGGTALTIDFSVDSIILWTAPSGTAAITLQNYTAGAQVKVIIAMTTSRDVTYGISSAANSSDGADNFNGAGGGSVSIANTAMHLEYTCISAVAGGCYVKVTVL